MSRIGKLPVSLPAGVQLTCAKGAVTVKGPKGTLTRTMPSQITITVQEAEKTVAVQPCDPQDKTQWALWGLYRVLIDNMVTGVTKGFQKILEIEGIGYKAEMKGRNLVILAGFSHPFLYVPREGVTIAAETATKVVINGIDKEAVGQVAAEIRKIRPPEPYKGKGIRYQGERIVRKAGKTGTK
ncbi:MAG: 50S ribosomal protein L6 [Chitinivibrionales bacterium]|nr:50S ribosomal protein L6 [Chitinivibrionales bacterium]